MARVPYICTACGCVLPCRARHRREVSARLTDVSLRGWSLLAFTALENSVSELSASHAGVMKIARCSIAAMANVVPIAQPAAVVGEVLHKPFFLLERLQGLRSRGLPLALPLSFSTFAS